jgi:hypothetical protein
MGRIDARRIIASMKNAQPVMDRAVMQLPGEAVNSKIVSGKIKVTITVTVSSSDPQPAFIGSATIYVCPKALF